MSFPYFIRVMALGLMANMPVDGSAQDSAGIEPEVQALLISESEMQAQIVIKNKGDEPILLHTNLYDVPDDVGIHLLALSPVSRIEAKGQQVIRFVLEKPPKPLQVQHYKRVMFEGIPVKKADATGSRIKISTRYDLPVIISPGNLKQIDAPWELLEWTATDRQLMVRNPSPFVVRMSSGIDLMPAMQRIEFAQRTYILPGETIAIPIADPVDLKTTTQVRLFPATVYGFAGPNYDATVKH